MVSLVRRSARGNRVTLYWNVVRALFGDEFVVEVEGGEVGGPDNV